MKPKLIISAGWFAAAIDAYNNIHSIWQGVALTICFVAAISVTAPWSDIGQWISSIRLPRLVPLSIALLAVCGLGFAYFALQNPPVPVVNPVPRDYRDVGRIEKTGCIGAEVTPDDGEGMGMDRVFESKGGPCEGVIRDRGMAEYPAHQARAWGALVLRAPGMIRTVGVGVNAIGRKGETRRFRASLEMRGTNVWCVKGVEQSLSAEGFPVERELEPLSDSSDPVDLCRQLDAPPESFLIQTFHDGTQFQVKVEIHPGRTQYPSRWKPFSPLRANYSGKIDGVESIRSAFGSLASDQVAFRFTISNAHWQRDFNRRPQVETK